MITRDLNEYKKIENEYNEKLQSFPEEWKDLKFEGVVDGYKISNHGRIKTLNDKIKKIIMLGGYAYVRLNTNDGEKKSFQISHLVALSFIDIPDELIQKGYNTDTLKINNKNGIKYCNAVFNLEWVVPETQMKSESISESVVHEICKYLEEGRPNKYIIEKTGVSNSIIYSIQSGNTWKKISNQYNITSRVNSLDDDTIHSICRELSDGVLSGNAIAKKYGVSRNYIHALRKKVYRPDITNQYDFDKFVVKEQISDEVIHNICKDIQSGNYTVSYIANKYGISTPYVMLIKQHKKRTNISKLYDF